MGLFDSLRPADINAGVREFRETPGAKLIDVRTPAVGAATAAQAVHEQRRGRLGHRCRYGADLLQRHVHRAGDILCGVSLRRSGGIRARTGEGTRYLRRRAL